MIIHLMAPVRVYRRSPSTLWRWNIDAVLTNVEDIRSCCDACLAGTPQTFRFTIKGNLGRYEGEAYITHIDERGVLRATGTNMPRLL